MQNKEFKRHIAYEVLTILGTLALLLFVCRLWPILLLVILGIFIAAMRLLFLSARKVENTALLSAGVTPDSFDFEEQRLAEAFRELLLMRRRILEMLFVEDLTPSEIAAKLHCSVQHVYNQRSLAIKRLRERLI